MSDLQIKRIYDKLQDDESRMIFKHRLLFYLDGDFNHIFNMIDELDGFDPALTKKHYPQWKNIPEFIEIYESHPAPVIAYGAGWWAEYILNLLDAKEIEVACLCDGNPELTGSIKYGYQIMSPEILESDYRDAYIVISTWSVAMSEILERLLNSGFSREKIFWFPPVPIGGDEQYFGMDFINYSDNEVYVDVGCLDGYTIQKFIEHCGGNYKKIYGMEPDPRNFIRTQQCVNDNGFENVVLVEKGAWSKEDILRFSCVVGGGFQISADGEDSLAVTSTDDMVGDDAVTFIKMDVEGAELEALKGAASTIKRNKPKLAICVYHKAADIIEIPVFIESLTADYKFYLRHHTNSYMETVLYAVM